MKRVIGLITLLLLIATPVMAQNHPTQYIFRLYNPVTSEHLYTSDESEAVGLSWNGWDQEGESWISAKDFGTPVYRLYNAGLDDHLFTSDENEVNVLTQNGWVADFNRTPIFYSLGQTPIYRLYNPILGRHLLTINKGEYDILSTQDWIGEGIAFYGIAPNIDKALDDGSCSGVIRTPSFFPFVTDDGIDVNTLPSIPSNSNTVPNTESYRDQDYFSQTESETTEEYH